VVVTFHLGIEEDEYPDLPRFGKSRSWHSQYKSKMKDYHENVIQPLKIERDTSQNDRFRDYSPGDVKVQTPSCPFPGLNLKRVNNMFDTNDKVLNNDRYKQDISQKYRVENKSKGISKNAYHLPHSQNEMGTKRISRKLKQNRSKIDTSNYSVKSVKNSKQVAIKHQKHIKQSLGNSEFTHNRRNRRNNQKVQNQLTYSAVLGPHHEEFSKSTGFRKFNQISDSLPFYKK